MTAQQIQKWERTKEIAESCKVTWRLRDMVELYDARGFVLGYLTNVDEAHAFLCGYEHSRTGKEQQHNDEART